MSMSRPGSTAAGPSSRSNHRTLSDMAAQRLGGLLAGLDQLEPLLNLPSHPDASGEEVVFARFRLRSRLGAGRFGIVLLAYDTVLGREVVVKVPQPAVLADSGLRDRFGREARATARLDHAGIVPVYEAGEVGGLPYLAAALIPGGSLHQWRVRHPGPVPPREAAQLVSAVARAVHHAHERGVLHCDLTPSNILLQPNGPAAVSGDGSLIDGNDAGELDATETGGGQNCLATRTPVVTDFGLARITDDDPTLTMTFQVVGTPLYMAPEQARGDRRNLTSRTDVYALGVLLYDLLVGHTPFHEGTAADILAQVQRSAVRPPIDISPQIPVDLNAICLKCLEKNADDRYASALALAEDLERFQIGLPVTARAISTPRRVIRWVARNPVPAGSILCALFTVGLATGVAADRWVREVQTRAELSTKVAAHEAATARAEASEAQARAAEFYAILERIRHRRATQVTGWTLANRADLQQLQTIRSAGADSAAVRTEIAALAATVDLGTPRPFAVGFHAGDISFSPDGNQLAVGSFSTGDNGIGAVRFLSVADGTEIRRLTFAADREWESRANGRQDGCWCASFSPDGLWFVVGTRSGRVVVWELAQPQPEPSAQWRHSATVDLSPDSVPHDRVTRILFDDQGLLWTGDERTAAAWDPLQGWKERERQQGYLCRPGAGSAVAPARVLPQFAASSPDNQFLVRRHQSLELTLALPDGTRVGQVTLPDDQRADDNGISDLVVTPDGTGLITTAEHAGHLKLWDLVSGRLLAARNLGHGNLRIAMAASGQRFAIAEADRVELFEMLSSNCVDPMVLSGLPIEDFDLSANGQYLAVLAILPERSESWIRVWNLSGSDSPVPSPELSLPGPWGASRRRLTLAPSGTEIVAHQLGAITACNLLTSQRNDISAAFNARDVRFSPDGTLWAIHGASVLVRRVDGTQMSAAAGSSVTCLAADDKETLVGCSDGTVVSCSPDQLAYRVRKLADVAITGLARNGDQIIAGTSAGELIIWAADGSAQRFPQAHADMIWCIARGPNGWFATGSGDRQLRLWDAQGRLLLALPHSRPVRRITWTPDGKSLLVLAEGERAIRRWRIPDLRRELAAFGSDFEP